MDLSPPAVRVLGVLAEKAMATPQQYPLSEAAVVAGCNQATNRDPVVSYDVDVVRRALLELREAGLARTVHRSGERATKHRHLLAEALELTAAEIAVLAILLLRGPQTLGDLRTRTERLHPFADLDAVRAVIDGLVTRAHFPLLRWLDRQPGQNQPRVRHLLGLEGEEAVVAPRPAARGDAARGDAARGDGARGDDGGGDGQGADGERPRPPSVARLAEEIAELQARVAALERRIGTD
jgi:uncharacterized protein